MHIMWCFLFKFQQIVPCSTGHARWRHTGRSERHTKNISGKYISIFLLFCRFIIECSYNIFFYHCRSSTRRKARTRKVMAATSRHLVPTNLELRNTKATISSHCISALLATTARRATNPSGTWSTLPPPSSANVSLFLQRLLFCRRHCYIGTVNCFSVPRKSS